ncbi:DNA-directed RNA polymerase subunit omega [Oscillospiraceae bacterium OttesenSCG-928-F05]|nr:DNA-directed RNA polymerase subunit omega [Oscillospiraceae bacterium OttesenSCG-928-F05]
MLYPSISNLLQNIDNQYLLVNIVARRAREIADELEQQGERAEEKPVKLAINEVAAGLITGRLREGFVSAAES